MTTDTSSGAGDGPRRRSGRSSRPPAPARTAASSSTSSTDDALVEYGRVGRPHGLDGSFYVTRPEASLAADVLTVAGVARRVVRRASTDAKPILRLEGVTGREAAEALRGEPLLVARADTPPLEEDEYWADDLVGLRVVDGSSPVGVVERVRSLPSCEVLEVGELLIPLVGDAVRSVDVEAGVIDVDTVFLEG